MKLKKTAALLLAAMMTVSPVYTYAEILDTGVDAPGTEKTDETIGIVLSSEPSCIWAAPVGKTENEAQIIFGALADRLVNVNM